LTLVLKSLIYFHDAEIDEDPELFERLSWSEELWSLPGRPPRGHDPWTVIDDL
jgi:hypothetical protein